MAVGSMHKVSGTQPACEGGDSTIAPDVSPGIRFRPLGALVVGILITALLAGVNTTGHAQLNSPLTRNETANITQGPTISRFVDQPSGLMADDLVAYALGHNLELQAMRKEIDAAKALVKQARLRANPKVDLSVSQNATSTDHNIDVDAMLPLELGGRRAARIAVAEHQVEVREHEFANRERLLAAEVRLKFADTLAQILKLSLTDELVESNQQSFNLVAARVSEGATPPLEQNMVLVELNRLKSMRESAEGKVEIAMLALRNLV